MCCAFACYLLIVNYEVYFSYAGTYHLYSLRCRFPASGEFGVWCIPKPWLMLLLFVPLSIARMLSEHR